MDGELTDKKLQARKPRAKKVVQKVSKKPKFQEGKHVMAQDLAKKLGVKVRQIRNLAQEDILITEETQSGPRYLLVESLVNYINHLKSNEEKTSIDARKATADARLKEAKAEKEEIALELMRGEVHRAEHVSEIFGFTITELRSQLLALPDRCAIDCSKVTPIEASGVIKKAVYEILSYMSQLSYNPSKFSDRMKEDGDMVSIDLENE